MLRPKEQPKTVIFVCLVFMEDGKNRLIDVQIEKM